MSVDRLLARYLQTPAPTLLAATLLCGFSIQAHADSDAPISDAPIEVGVRIDGDAAIVDVSFYVGATPEEAWAVMTDYDHATAFISKLEKSAVLARTDELLLVAQKGSMGFGPFSLTIDTVTEVRLTPYEKMEARMVSGNMKKNESTTRLVADANGTRVVYHLESIPDAWMPPLIGRAIIEFETRARFRQLIDEILRRKALPGAANMVR